MASQEERYRYRLPVGVYSSEKQLKKRQQELLREQYEKQIQDHKKMYGKKTLMQSDNSPISYNNSLILSNPQDKGLNKNNDLKKNLAQQLRKQINEKDELRRRNSSKRLLMEKQENERNLIIHQKQAEFKKQYHDKIRQEMIDDYRSRASRSMENKKMEQMEKERTKALYEEIEKNVINKKLGFSSEYQNMKMSERQKNQEEALQKKYQKNLQDKLQQRKSNSNLNPPFGTSFTPSPHTQRRVTLPQPPQFYNQVSSYQSNNLNYFNKNVQSLAEERNAKYQEIINERIRQNKIKEQELVENEKMMRLERKNQLKKMLEEQIAESQKKKKETRDYYKSNFYGEQFKDVYNPICNPVDSAFCKDNKYVISSLQSKRLENNQSSLARSGSYALL